jgi:hypothetical protein
MSVWIKMFATSSLFINPTEMCGLSEGEILHQKVAEGIGMTSEVGWLQAVIGFSTSAAVWNGLVERSMPYFRLINEFYSSFNI